MAIVRWEDDSDVYVYEDVKGGFVCEGCADIGKGFSGRVDGSTSYRCSTAAEMLLHLLDHREKGHKVPERAIEALKDES
jgi:hypothetical protein